MDRPNVFEKHSFFNEWFVAEGAEPNRKRFLTWFLSPILSLLKSIEKLTSNFLAILEEVFPIGHEPSRSVNTRKCQK
jgi:hypothetical protein